MPSKVYELVESITRELNFVEFWQSTQKMPRFVSDALHKVYEFVESITHEVNFVEFWQSTQKKRLEIKITLDPELDL